VQVRNKAAVGEMRRAAIWHRAPAHPLPYFVAQALVVEDTPMSDEDTRDCRVNRISRLARSR